MSADAVRNVQCPFCYARLPIHITQSRTGLVMCETAVVHRCEPVDSGTQASRDDVEKVMAA